MDQIQPPSFTVGVVGMRFQHPMVAALVASSLVPGTGLIAYRERDNPVDQNAIAVVAITNLRIGYLHQEHAKLVAPWMDKGWIFHTSVIAVAADFISVRMVPLKSNKETPGKAVWKEWNS